MENPGRIKPTEPVVKGGAIPGPKTTVRKLYSSSDFSGPPVGAKAKGNSVKVGHAARMGTKRR
jgi:hypothetical protein